MHQSSSRSWTYSVVAARGSLSRSRPRGGHRGDAIRREPVANRTAAAADPGDIVVRPRIVLEEPPISRPPAPTARLDERERPRKVSVIVIGAGIAGLVAAYHLKRRGIRVAVLEAA